MDQNDNPPNGTIARIYGNWPDCDACLTPTPAAYDCKTKAGPWGFLCETHYTVMGVGLGLGLGQRLVRAE